MDELVRASLVQNEQLNFSYHYSEDHIFRGKYVPGESPDSLQE